MDVPVDAAWYPDFEGEYLGFPAAKYDDQADCLSLMGRHLDKIWGGEEAKEEPPPRLVPPGGWTLAELEQANMMED